MKTNFFAVLLALLGVLTIGCQKLENSPPKPQYLLAIELLDQQGNNISEIAGAKTTGEVLRSDDNAKKMYLETWSYIPKEDEIRYLMLSASGYFSDDKLSSLSLTWKLKCKEVFDDDQFRIIESNWTKAEGRLYPDRCVSFVFEGKTYVPELKNGYWTARVVVTR